MVVRVPALAHLLACSIIDSHEHLESTSYVVATSEQGTAIRELLGPRCREGSGELCIEQACQPLRQFMSEQTHRTKAEGGKRNRGAGCGGWRDRRQCRTA